MVNVLFLFPQATDAKSLDEFLFTKMIPGIKQAQGVRSVKLSNGELMGAGGPAPYSKVLEVTFDSLPSVMANIQSPGAQAAREFHKNAGTLILMYELNEL